jgi:hypothetical protein
VHSTQATAAVDLESPTHGRKIEAMIEDALEGCWPLLAPAVRRRLTAKWLADARALRAFTLETARRRHRPAILRAGRLARLLCAGSPAAREYLMSRLLRREPTHRVLELLKSAGQGPSLVWSDGDPGSPGPHHLNHPVSQILDKT